MRATQIGAAPRRHRMASTGVRAQKPLLLDHASRRPAKRASAADCSCVGSKLVSLDAKHANMHPPPSDGQSQGNRATHARYQLLWILVKEGRSRSELATGPHSRVPVEAVNPSCARFNDFHAPDQKPFSEPRNHRKAPVSASAGVRPSSGTNFPTLLLQTHRRMAIVDPQRDSQVGIQGYHRNLAESPASTGRKGLLLLADTSLHVKSSPAENSTLLLLNLCRRG